MDAWMAFKTSFGHVHADSWPTRWCVQAVARGEPYEHHSASGTEGSSAGGLFAEGPGDRRPGSRALRTRTEPDGSSMVGEPGLQPWIRRTSIRGLRAAPAQAQVAAGFD